MSISSIFGLHRLGGGGIMQSVLRIWGDWMIHVQKYPDFCFQIRFGFESRHVEVCEGVGAGAQIGGACRAIRLEKG